MSSKNTSTIWKDLCSLSRILASTKPNSAILQYDEPPYDMVHMSDKEKACVLDIFMGSGQCSELGDTNGLADDDLQTRFQGSVPWKNTLRMACLRLLEGTVRA